MRRPDVSLAGASVAFVSVDGPPAAISANFSQIMAREAAAHDIVVADAKKARYLVRGYLSAYATTDGAAVEYVWDVFNKDKQRTQRVNDVLEVKGEGADPWRIVGEAALASVAAKSADDLAAFLSNTPEAMRRRAPVRSQPLALRKQAPELRAGQLISRLRAYRGRTIAANAAVRGCGVAGHIVRRRTRLL